MAGKFEELIAHGNDMFRRLEALSCLPEDKMKKRPPYEQVSTKEIEEWLKAVENRLQITVGPDAVARYKIIMEVQKDEGKTGYYTEFAAAINLNRRIVAYLTELKERLEV